MIRIKCKWFLLCYLFSMIINPAIAQQKPHYTQYLMNQYIINPALTGIENYTDIKLSHRHQWVGIMDAPVTTYFTIHKAIHKSDTRTTPTSFEVPVENPRGRQYWKEYEAPAPHHGIGMQIINDRTGPLNRFSGLLTYAYHMALTQRTSIAAGISAGVTNISINASKLEFYSPIDPAVFGSGVLNNFRPDVNLGLYLYSADYFLGVSALQIYPQKINFSDGSVNETKSGKSVPHIFVTGGYRFMIGDNWNIIPSIMLKYVQPLPVQFDLNTRLAYRDRFWFGVGGRLDDGFSAMAGMNISHTVNIGYSYDYNTSRYYNYSKGTHEILLGFTISKQLGFACPRNVW